MCKSLGVVPLELANDLQIELRAEFGPIVFGSSHLHGRNRKGRKARGKAMTAITAEFDKLMDNEAKSCLLDAVIKEIAGPEEFDKCRLGCAMVDSLKRFEEKLESDLSEEAREKSMLALGAHCATIPRAGLKLGREYSRLTGLDVRMFPKLRGVLDNLPSYHTKTGLFEQKPRGLALITRERQLRAIQYWRENSSPQMMGVGRRCRVNQLNPHK